MPDSLLLLFLVLAMSLAFILMVGPEILQRLSSRNLRRRRQITSQLQQLDQRLKTAAARLLPFRDMKAATHKELYAVARDTLAAARDNRKAIRLHLEKLTLVKVPEAGWPAPFFLQRPQHFVTIPLDGWRLWRVRKNMEKIATGLDQAEVRQAKLDKVPDALRQTCHDLAGQQGLAALASRLAGEQRAGVANLTSWQRRLDALQREQADLAQDLELDPDAPLEEVDDLAVRLEQLESNTRHLTTELETAHQERTALDEQLAAADQALSELPSQADPEITPLVHRASALLQQAYQLRDQYELSAATQHQADCQAILTLAGHWQKARPVLNQLDQIRPVAALAAERDTLLDRRRHLAGRNQALAEIDAIRLLGQPESDQLVLYSPDTPRAVSQAVVDLHNQAESLIQQHSSRLLKLSRETEQANQKLTAAWQKLQQIRPLDKDPLTWRYQGLQQQLGASSEDAQALDTFIQSARQATDQLDQARKELESVITTTEKMLQSLPILANQVREQAEIWACFRRAFETIDDYQGQAHRVWDESAASGNLEQIKRAAAEVGDLSSLAAAKADEVDQQADHLETLEAGLSESLNTLTEAGIEMDGEHVDPSMRMLETYWRKARLAKTYQAAVDALNHASSYARKLF